jgi:hypothetical protein
MIKTLKADLMLSSFDILIKQKGKQFGYSGRENGDSVHSLDGNRFASLVVSMCIQKDRGKQTELE